MKVYPEQLEIKAYQVVRKNIDMEERTNGEIVYVVKDLNKLIFDILELNEENKKTN